jgi:hypothetical protein
MAVSKLDLEELESELESGKIASDETATRFFEMAKKVTESWSYKKKCVPYLNLVADYLEKGLPDSEEFYMKVLKVRAQISKKLWDDKSDAYNTIVLKRLRDAFFDTDD